jgi:hypothetical protein
VLLVNYRKMSAGFDVVVGSSARARERLWSSWLAFVFASKRWFGRKQELWDYLIIRRFSGLVLNFQEIICGLLCLEASSRSSSILQVFLGNLDFTYLARCASTSVCTSVRVQDTRCLVNTVSARHFCEVSRGNR